MSKFILIFRKGSKRPLGAIPVKKGVTIAKLRRGIPKQLKSGFRARIITKNQLKNIILRLRPRKTRRTKRRKFKMFRRKRKR